MPIASPSEALSVPDLHVLSCLGEMAWAPVGSLLDQGYASGQQWQSVGQKGQEDRDSTNIAMTSSPHQPSCEKPFPKPVPKAC